MPSLFRESQLARLSVDVMTKRIEEHTRLRTMYMNDINRYEPYLKRITDDVKKIKLSTVYSDQSMLEFTGDAVIFAVKVPNINSEKFCKMTNHASALKDVMNHKAKCQRSINRATRHISEYTGELATRR